MAQSLSDTTVQLTRQVASVSTQMLHADVGSMEIRLENDLKRTLSEWRAEQLGIGTTPWDDGLAFLLMPSLSGYEQEAVTVRCIHHCGSKSVCLTLLCSGVLVVSLEFL